MVIKLVLAVKVPPQEDGEGIHELGLSWYRFEEKIENLSFFLKEYSYFWGFVEKCKSWNIYVGKSVWKCENYVGKSVKQENIATTSLFQTK